MMLHGTTNDFINYLTQQRRNPVMDAFRPYISRVVAPFIVAFIAWLASFGINLPGDYSDKLTELIVFLIIATAQALYAIIHRSIDKKLNPVDAATTPLAVAGKVEEKTATPTVEGA